MEGWVLNSGLGWIGAAGGIIVGIFALANLFDKGITLRRREKDKLDEEFISSLKRTIDELQAKYLVVEGQQKENMALINQLVGENKVMKQILEGRDEKTIESQNAAIETHKLMKHLTSSFDKFLVANSK